jgi:hypothetical protein
MTAKKHHKFRSTIFSGIFYTDVISYWQVFNFSYFKISAMLVESLTMTLTTSLLLTLVSMTVSRLKTGTESIHATSSRSINYEIYLRKMTMSNIILV